jgi:chemotaxis protein MotA
LANLVLLPIGNRLKSIIGRQVRYKEMIVDGLIGIANGDNPRIIDGRLRGYVD